MLTAPMEKEIGSDLSGIDWVVYLSKLVRCHSQLVPKGKKILKANGNMTGSLMNAKMVLVANPVVQGVKICGRS
jgi:hypothetical protein